MTPEERGFYIVGGFFLFIPLRHGASTGHLTHALGETTKPLNAWLK